MGWTHVSIAAAVVAPSWLYDDSPPRVSRKIDGIVLTEKGKSRWTPVEYVCISASPKAVSLRSGKSATPRTVCQAEAASTPRSVRSRNDPGTGPGSIKS